MTARPPASVAVVVLAAGEGTRMRSTTPKVLHEMCGRSLLGHALVAARAAGPADLVVVVGHGRDRVRAAVLDLDPAATVAVQERQLGTGDAVACGLAALPVGTRTVLVMGADTPLLHGDTLRALLDLHLAGAHAVTVLTARVPDPHGYGRIVRGPSGAVERIVEERDATPEQRRTDEVNAGVYAFDVATLRSSLGRLSPDNGQGELLLTDVLALARAAGGGVAALTSADRWQSEGVNDRAQLARLRTEFNRRIVDAAMRDGVTVEDPATTWIDVQAELAADVTLRPGVQVLGSTRIAADAVVGPDCTLRDTVVGAGASVVRAHCDGAEIGPRATVGPFTVLRPGTRLGDAAKAGSYVEIKASTVGSGTKVPHLSYIGDAEIGEQTNIGAATVVVNYDGVSKHRTRIGDHVRIGSDTMLVAPVTIGDGAYTAAGSVITGDVPPGALGVGRSRQRNVEGWVPRRRRGTGAAAAAARAQAAPAADGSTSNDQTGDRDPEETGP